MISTINFIHLRSDIWHIIGNQELFLEFVFSFGNQPIFNSDNFKKDMYMLVRQGIRDQK